MWEEQGKVFIWAVMIMQNKPLFFFSSPQEEVSWSQGWWNGRKVSCCSVSSLCLFSEEQEVVAPPYRCCVLGCGHHSGAVPVMLIACSHSVLEGSLNTAGWALK